MKPLLTLFVTILCSIIYHPAQASRSSVSSAEVNGTFVKRFQGEYKEFSSKIIIKALGHQKLNIDFDLVYPYKLNDGELSANMGTLSGEATIVGDTATYQSNEYGPCKITMVFSKPGELVVTQEGSDFECGFGHNVSAEGNYLKMK